jgi:hypothetical protein
MKIAEFYLRHNKMNGLLLCKENLIPFYDAMCWNKYNGRVLVDNKPFNNITYIKNLVFEKEINIDRNF